MPLRNINNNELSAVRTNDMSKQCAFPAEWTDHKRTILALELPEDISDLEAAVENTRLVLVSASIKWFVINPSARNLKGKTPEVFENKHYKVQGVPTGEQRITPRCRLASVTPRTRDTFVHALTLYHALDRNPSPTARQRVNAFAARILAKHAQCMASLRACEGGAADSV